MLDPTRPVEYEGDGDVVDVDFVLPDEIEEGIQSPLKDVEFDFVPVGHTRTASRTSFMVSRAIAAARPFPSSITARTSSGWAR